MTRQRLEPAEPWTEEPKAVVAVAEPAAEADARPEREEEPNQLYYRSTFSHAEAEEFVRLGTVEAEAKAALASVEAQRDALDRQIMSLTAEAEGRAAERVQREADIERLGEAGDVNGVQAAQARIAALDAVDVRRLSVRERLEAQRAKLVAEPLPKAQEALRKATAATQAWTDAHRGQLPRWEVDALIRGQLAHWLAGDTSRSGWLDLSPKADAVVFAKYVAALPDETIRWAASAPAEFSAALKAVHAPKVEPRPSKEEALRSIERLRGIVAEYERDERARQDAVYARVQDRAQVAALNGTGA